MIFSPNRRIAIIGAGPAGMACALWCKRAGLEPILIDSSPIMGGASAGTRSINHWMLGQPGQDARSFARQWADHIALEHVPFLGFGWAESAARMEEGGIRLEITVSEKRITLDAAALVIATGERQRGRETFTETPGFEAVEIAGCITFDLDNNMLGAQHSGKRIAVIGGGDNAYDTALSLLPHVRELYLVMRGSPRAQAHMREALTPWREKGTAILHRGLSIESFVHAHNEVTLNLVDRDGTLSALTVDHVLARLGNTPNSESVAQLLTTLGELALHPTGHIMTDADTRTTIDRVYAAGDVANPGHPCVPTAIALGTMAARTIGKDLFQS